MRLRTKKGFLLLDSLITVFVTSMVCVACYSIYKSVVNYEEGYIQYQNESNNRLVTVFNNLYECEPCILDESD